MKGVVNPPQAQTASASYDRYIQAASSPKDVIILMDISGSMTGQRNEIAKATVLKILDTLSDEDYFNVIRVSLMLVFS